MSTATIIWTVLLILALTLVIGVKPPDDEDGDGFA